jgi:tetratricopeptide (TPR) repeat protein
LYLVLLFYFRQKTYSFLLLFFGLAFGVTLNLLTPIGTVFAERLMYFPSVGLSIFVIAFMDNHFKKWQFNSFSLVFLAFLLFQTYSRIPVWQDNESVFRQALIDNPRSAKTHYMLASYLILENKALPEAKQILRQAYRIDPAFIENSRLLVDLAIKEKYWSEAEFWCKEVLRFAPNDLKVKEKLEILLKAKQFGQKHE